VFACGKCTPSVKDHSNLTHDKLHKVRWMLDEVQDRFKKMWLPNQQLTVDKSMVMYKGQCCPIGQYLPKKPMRFGIKVWVAVDSLLKYLWNFEVYCRKQGNPHDEDSASKGDMGNLLHLEGHGPRSSKGEGLQGRNVVKELLKDLYGRGHIVTTNNFFTFVPLFLDLLENGIMATRTLRTNRKYIPRAIFAKKIMKTKHMGWIDY
jgi:hypothetical protein